MARRARRFAGLGVGTDPVDHRVQRGTALPTASGRGHGVLRAPHSGLGRRSRILRDVADRRSRNGLRDTGSARTGPEGIPYKVGSYLILRQEQARDSSPRPERKHGGGGCRGACVSSSTANGRSSCTSTP